MRIVGAPRKRAWFFARNSRDPVARPTQLGGNGVSPLAIVMQVALVSDSKFAEIALSCPFPKAKSAPSSTDNLSA